MSIGRRKDELERFERELLYYLDDYVNLNFSKKEEGLLTADNLGFHICLDFRKQYNCYILKDKYKASDDPKDAPKVSAIEFSEYNEHTEARLLKFIKSEWKYYDDYRYTGGSSFTTSTIFSLSF